MQSPEPQPRSVAAAALPRPVPMFGNLWQLRKNPLGFFTRIARNHGDFVRLRVGLDGLWLVSHPDLVEAMLVTHRDAFTKDHVTRGLSAVLGQGLLTADGETWRRSRRLCAPSFQPRHIAVYGDAMVAAGRAHVPEPGVVDIHETMTAVALDVVLATLFGGSSHAGTDRVGPVLTELMTAFEREQRSLWRFVPAWVPGPHRRRARAHTAELHALVLRIVAERRARGPGDDLLWRLLEARDEDGTGLDDTQVRDEAMTLFLAGHETTALALSYASWLLALHPEVQERLRAEVQALGRDPGAADLHALPFTAAVVKETLRLYPPAWGFGRESTAPVTLAGVTLPAGEHVVAMPWILHRDPRWWRDPDAFRPDRWLGDELEGLPRMAYVPFGAGPRVCIGNHFATLEVILVLAVLLARRRLVPVPGFVPELAPAVTLRSRNGVWVDVRPL